MQKIWNRETNEWNFIPDAAYRNKYVKPYRLGECERGDVCVTRYHYAWRTGTSEKPSYRFRIDPVPFIGNCKNCHSGTWMRHMKTTQELRLNDKYKGYTRGKRRNLSTNWDDICRADKLDRSWKNCTKRKRQWMK